MVDRAELNELMAEAEQGIVPKDLREQGWVYKDMPSRLTHEGWDKFLNLLGEGNYQVLVMSSGPDWKRGQFLLSPKAFENMKNYKK